MQSSTLLFQTEPCAHEVSSVSGNGGGWPWMGKWVPEHTIPILRAVHGVDAHGSVFLARIGDVDAHRLGMREDVLGLAHDNLDNLAILAKVLLTAKRFE